MSLKENVEYIKDEISTEETFIEKFFKVEQFYKKYKKVMIGTAIVAVVGFVGNSIKNYTDEQNMIKDNTAFNNVIANSADTKSLDYLKVNNTKLYQLALYMQDNTKANNLEFLTDLAKYAEAMKTNDIDKISSLTQKQDFLLNDFAIFNKALIQAQNNKFQDAKETLKLIPVTSSVLSLSKTLDHYLLTK